MREKRDKDDERERQREKGLKREGRERGREMTWRSGGDGASVWRRERWWGKRAVGVAGKSLG